ncbi:calcium-binding protein [Nocardia sp. CA-151230]|uniref:calcium-binding protein n=1 Tax=Nocardia sp. CA-151230 TaxID=3239982 RepID=UPI003D8A6416
MDKLTKAQLEAMVEEATVDAYGDEEQLVGFYTMIADNLEIPFETEVFGLTVTVDSIDLLPGSGVVAICTFGRYSRSSPALTDSERGRMDRGVPALGTLNCVPG